MTRSDERQAASRAGDLAVASLARHASSITAGQSTESYNNTCDGASPTTAAQWRAAVERELDGRVRQRRRTSDRAVVALCTAPARWYVRAGCGGCAVDLLLRVELRHPDCAVHTGPSRCPRHGGADAPFQCEPCRIAR